MSLAENWLEQIQGGLAHSGDGPAWVAELRRRGSEAFSESGLPHRKVEDWKYTSLKLLEARSHRLVSEADAAQGASVEWPRPVLKEHSAHLKMLNGQLLPDREVSPGLRIWSLQEALADAENEPWLRPVIESLPVEGPAVAFSALNTSMLRNGLVIRVPAGVDGGNLLLQWAFNSAPPAMMFNTRLVIVLDEGASLNLVEQFESHESLPHALNLVSQVRVANDASLGHIRIQNESPETSLITRTECEVHNGGQFRSSSFDWGAGWTRHDSLVRLLGDEAHGELNGAFVLSGDQHLDHHVFVDHVAGGSSSSQFFRGVLDGSSRGVFNGKARIARGADGSSIRQSNANLLLSAMAEIDTKPELEIYADEVEASHGATVGQLDEDAVFYLRTRGLNDEAARALLTGAFCKAVLDKSLQLPGGLAKQISSRIDNALVTQTGFRSSLRETGMTGPA